MKDACLKHNLPLSIVAALLSLKKAAVIVPWIIPLIVATVIFSFYIRERHFVVTEHLPMRLCLQQDEKNKHLDFSFVEDAFLQPEMRKKEGRWWLDYCLIATSCGIYCHV